MSADDMLDRAHAFLRKHENTCERCYGISREALATEFASIAAEHERIGAERERRACGNIAADYASGLASPTVFDVCEAIAKRIRARVTRRSDGSGMITSAILTITWNHGRDAVTCPAMGLTGPVRWGTRQ